MGELLPSIFILGAAGGGLFAFVALWMSLRLAFADPSAEQVSAELGSETSRALQTEKEALLEELRDISFEHEAGKLSDEDYEELNDKLRARARHVLVLLDDRAGTYRDEAEALIAAHLGHQDASAGEREADS